MALAEGGVTLDASGDGRIIFPAPPPFHRWEVERVSVTVTGGSGGNLGGSVRLYLGAPTATNFLDGSETPWLDVATFAPGQVTIFAGQQLRAEFEGCGAAQTASVVVEGAQVRL